MTTSRLAVAFACCLVLSACARLSIPAEAQAALERFTTLTTETKTQIGNWLATHPPEKS